MADVIFTDHLFSRYLLPNFLSLRSTKLVSTRFSSHTNLKVTSRPLKYLSNKSALSFWGTSHTLLPESSWQFWEDKKKGLPSGEDGQGQGAWPSTHQKPQSTLSAPLPKFNKNVPPRPHPGILFSKATRSHFWSACYDPGKLLYFAKSFCHAPECFPELWQESGSWYQVEASLVFLGCHQDSDGLTLMSDI